jgi:hypothetical protein
MKFTIEQIDNGWVLQQRDISGRVAHNVFCTSLDKVAEELLKRGTVRRVIADENDQVAA